MQVKKRVRRIAALNTQSSLIEAMHAGTRAPDLDLLMTHLASQLRIAMVFGGDKAIDGAVLRRAGNPRSWKSYESVARDIGASLQRSSFNIVGAFADDMLLPQRLKKDQTTFVWLNTGGVQGRNAISHAAAMHEMYGIPYVGHDPLTAALLDSKHHFKRQLQSLGIPTAPFYVWTPHDARTPAYPSRRLKAQFAKWPNGFVVKPVSGRASLHVHYVERERDLEATIRHVHEVTQNAVLVEAFLAGREYCVGVAGPTLARKGKFWRLPGPVTFSALERRLGRNEKIFTSMDVKPITASRTRMLDRSKDEAALEQIESIARSVYVGTPLQTLVRLDLRADDRGVVHVLEANPKPDLAAPRAGSTSLISLGLAELDMTYDDLVLSVLADRLSSMFATRPGSIEEFLASFAYTRKGRRS